MTFSGKKKYRFNPLKYLWSISDNIKYIVNKYISGNAFTGLSMGHINGSDFSKEKLISRFFNTNVKH
jgi:hypothetical protein